MALEVKNGMLESIERHVSERVWYIGLETAAGEIKTEAVNVTWAGDHIDFAFAIDPEVTGGQVVTGINVYDRNDTVWARGDTEIDTSLNDEGVTYQVRFVIKVEEA